MSKTYKGDVTGNVVELNLLDANEGTLPNLGTPTVVTRNTGPNAVEQIVGDIETADVPTKNTVKGLVIGTSCTSIGSNAFGDCTGLTGDLVIPNSVTSIGSYAFYNCSGLTGSLTIPDSVTTIESRVFGECTGLTGDLVIPNSVTSIGSYAFYYCTGLTGSLTIPNSVTTIGVGAFSRCSGFTGDLVIPDSVTSIGVYAFNYGGYNSLLIPNSVTTIGSAAFSYCAGLTTAYLATPFANIPTGAFFYDGAFSLSGLTTVYAKDAVANGWTLGAGQTVGGKSGVTVIEWTNYPNIP